MKCLSCDRILNDYESTRKYPDGDYIDMCNGCFSASDLASMPVVVREDLAESSDCIIEIEFEDCDLDTD